MLKSQIKTPSDLKAFVDETGSHFFDRKTMRFFGDTMANFRLRKVEINGKEVFELSRKKPVKNGLNSVYYFDAETFKRIHNVE